MAIFDECIKRVERIAEESLSDVDNAPYVSIGGSTVQRPFEFIVREVPENVSITDRATSTTAMGAKPSGCYQIEFSVACQTWAKRKGVEEAAFMVAGWVERFMAAVASDKTLGGIALHAVPYIEQGGSAYENDRAVYLVAYDLGVRVKATLNPRDYLPKE